MANRVLVVFENGSYKGRASNAETLDFTSVRIGADNLEIAQGGTGGSAYFNLGSRAIRSSATPDHADALTNKAYVDAVRVASRIIGNVAVASTANIDLATGTLLVIDGYQTVAGDRVLVKNQTDPAENGIYVAAVGAWSRSADMDNSPLGEIYNGNLTAAILNGSQAGEKYVITSVGTGVDSVHQIGTDDITWSLFSSASELVAGAGLLDTGGTWSVELDTDPGLEFDAVGNAGQLRAKVDDSTIERHSTGLRVKDSGISTAKLADDAVTAAKINPDVAGAGLVPNGGTGALDVNVDDSTLEINTDTVRIKDLGVTTAKIAANAVTAAKLNSDVVGEGVRLNSGTNAIERDDTKTFTNDNAGSITVRQVVYVKANGNVDLADADLASLEDFALGVVEDASIATTASGKIIVRHGARVAGFAGLTPGKRYYVDATTAGAITATAPSASGQSVYEVGRALSATELLFAPKFIISIA